MTDINTTQLPDDAEECCRLIHEILREEIGTNEKNGSWGADDAVHDALVIAEVIIEGRDRTDALDNQACVSALDNLIVRARHVHKLQTQARERALKIARHGVSELRKSDADFKRRFEALDAGREPPRTASIGEVDAVLCWLESRNAADLELPSRQAVAEELNEIYRKQAET
ncbi:MAG: hypothetical protein AAF580_10125 [Pseudomonadota bacterium]